MCNFLLLILWIHKYIDFQEITFDTQVYLISKLLGVLF